MVTHGSVASYSQRVVFLADGSVVSVPEQRTPDAVQDRVRMLGDPPAAGRRSSDRPGRWVSPMLKASTSGPLAHCDRLLLR